MENIIQLNEKINSMHQKGNSPREIADFILKNRQVFEIWEESQVRDFNFDPRSEGAIIPVPYEKECYYPWGCNMLLSQIKDSPQYSLRYPENADKSGADATTDEYGNVVADNKKILALPSWILDLDSLFNELLNGAWDKFPSKESQDFVKIIASYGELVPPWVIDQLLKMKKDAYDDIVYHEGQEAWGVDLDQDERKRFSDSLKLEETIITAIDKIREFKKERKRGI